VLRSAATAQLAHRQPEQIPAILLGRMAVDEKHQHQGLGAAMLKHCITMSIEVSQRVGVRLLLVHAKDEDAKSFYTHYDFVPSPIDELTLMLPLP
jgi:GNAT superfamily N-acetyltransferase